MDLSKKNSILKKIFSFSQQKPSLQREFDASQAMPQAPDRHKVDPLQWWKANKGHLPLLAELAREWLCVPAASSSSERLFSQSGHIISSKRQNLDPSTSKKLTLIKVNYELVVKKIKVKLLNDEEREDADAMMEEEVEEKEDSPKPPEASSTPKPLKRRKPSEQGSQQKKRRVSIRPEDLFQTQSKAREGQS